MSINLLQANSPSKVVLDRYKEILKNTESISKSVISLPFIHFRRWRVRLFNNKDKQIYMSPLNILLIGLGNMGKIHKRVIENNSQTNLFGIVDTSFKKKHEKINGVEYFNEIQLVNLDDGLIDAVVISSTTRTHYKIAEKFLAKKIPVLLEKPISTEKNEIEELLNLAKAQNTIFRCGLIEIYNPIFNFIKELNLNDIISIHIYRHSQPASPREN